MIESLLEKLKEHISTEKMFKVDILLEKKIIGVDEWDGIIMK